jgi:hypothetical protein
VRTLTIPLRDVRIGGAVMLGAALVWPLVDQHVPLACPLRSATGIPCPLCGMTTSVVETTHGDPLAGLAANPAGVFAVVIALWLLFTRRPDVSLPRFALPLALTGMWVFELFRFDVL